MSAAPTHPCFRAEHVSKTYGQAEAETVALARVTVAIPWGARVAIVGPSGAGKSTLAHLLGLMDVFTPAPDADVVYFPRPGPGLSFAGRTGPDRVPLGAGRDGVRGRDFGFVFQRHHLLGYLSARDNVGLGLMAAGVRPAARRAAAEILLTRFGLAARVRHRPGQLSGGQSQRVAVARALAHNPRVVLADEPTGSLDRENAREVLAALAEWQAAGPPDAPRTLLLVTHDLPDAFEWCDHFLVLQDGRLHARNAAVGRPLTRTEVGSAENLFRLVADQPARSPRAPEEPLPGAAASQTTDGPPVRLPRSRMRRRDVFRFALVDLTARGHRAASGTSALLLMVATVLALAAVGFWNGQEAVRNTLDTSESRALVVTSYTGRVTYIDDSVLKRMQELRFADGRQVCRPANVFRWNRDQKLFRAGSDKPGPEQPDLASGRTIAPDDPALASRGWAFRDPAGPEVIVSEEFLRDHCRAPPDAGFIWLDCNRELIKLRVVGRAAELPDSQHYILPDPFYQLLRTEKFVSARRVAFVDLAFPDAAAADAAAGPIRAKAAADDLDLDVERPADDPRRVRLQVARGGRRDLARLEAQAQMLAAAARPGPVQVVPPPADANRTEPDQFGCATVYLDGMEDQDEAGRLLTGIGLKLAFPGQVQLVRRYNTTVRQLTLLVIGLAGVTVIGSGLNLSITMFQRVREKMAEIGILRACGVRKRQIQTIFAIEGIVLSGLATAAGWALLVWLLRPVIDRIVSGIGDDEAQLGMFHLEAGASACVVAGVVAAATAVCGLTCRLATRTEPADAIR